MKITRTLIVPALTGAVGLLVGLAGTAGAQPASTVSTALPSYCTAPVSVVRHYTVAVDAGDDALRSGIAGHGGKLDCITLDGGNYQKTIELNPGWTIPAGGLHVTYFNCLPGTFPGFRWTPTGKPYNDCAEEYAKATTTADGGLHITWPDYNGSPMFPPTTPYVTGTAVTQATSATAMTERPPECELVPIRMQGHVRAVWIDWCGTGSGGEQPMQLGVRRSGGLQGDGTTSLDPSSCTLANPCVVVWPGSPQS